MLHGAPRATLRTAHRPTHPAPPTTHPNYQALPYLALPCQKARKPLRTQALPHPTQVGVTTSPKTGPPAALPPNVPTTRLARSKRPTMQLAGVTTYNHTTTCTTPYQAHYAALLTVLPTWPTKAR